VAIAELFRKVGDYVMDTIRGEDGAFDGYDDNEDDYYYGGEEQDGNAVRDLDYSPITAIERRKETKIINHPSAMRGGNEVVVIEPRSFDDAAAIVQNLKDRKIVMVNLHLLDNSQSQRTIDFVCGASQALNGQPKKVGDGVFVFAPANVSLSDMTTQQARINDSLWRTSLQ
jgi:FtsZ-interacting cell division protein YlmF